MHPYVRAAATLSIAAGYVAAPTHAARPAADPGKVATTAPDRLSSAERRVHAAPVRPGARLMADLAPSLLRALRKRGSEPPSLRA